MKHDDVIALAVAMKTYGSLFVRALSHCFLTADSTNLQKLLNTFPEYVEQYSKMANIQNTKEE